MGKGPTRSEINGLKAQVLALPDLAKFELFDALREQLSGVFDGEHPEIRLIRERREAVLYIKKAAEHLQLPAREAPTKSQFDQVAKELDWEWDGARVIRVWERWRMATNAYLGTRRVDTPAGERRHGHARGPKDKTTEKHLESLRTWLASEPELEIRAAYDEFADAYNARLPTDAVPLVRASTINRGLPLSWENAIRVARRELPLEKAIKQDLAERLPVSDAQTLVGLPLIARVLNEDAQGTRELAQEDPKFPVPVAHLDGHAAWLYEDVKLYRRGLAVPKRKADEHQRLVMSMSETSTQLDLSDRAVRRAIRKKNWSRVPPPEGALGVGIHYWRREKVEAWREQQAKHAEAEAVTKRGEVGARSPAEQRKAASMAAGLKGTNVRGRGRKSARD